MGSKTKSLNFEGKTTATLKRCMPVFDALTSGYIILSPVDVFVTIKDGEQWFNWPSGDIISFHNFQQAPTHPDGHFNRSYPKWHNPWAIKTPKGYSTLFVQPFHRESVFTILPGIVDTDTYFNNVNFPFVMNDVTFEGLIPKGTPIAQVIPFKRDSWKMEIGSTEDQKSSHQIRLQLESKFFDIYKTMWWNKKEYK
jgi:hypothetical protein